MAGDCLSGDLEDVEATGAGSVGEVVGCCVVVSTVAFGVVVAGDCRWSVGGVVGSGVQE